MGKSNIKDRVGRARVPERTVDVCLRGDLVAEIEELEQRYATLVDEQDQRLGGNPEAVAAARRIVELQEEMRGDTVTFRLRGLPRRQWNKLLDEHPPRQGKARDGIGANADTFFPALLKKSVVEPQLDEEDWLELLGDDDTDGSLTSGQYDTLCGNVWDLNRKNVSVPFSLAGSLARQGSGNA